MSRRPGERSPSSIRRCGGWLHDVRWAGRARANIDHVVIGSLGVFVIDSKNWAGSVAVKAGVLRQNGRSREKDVVGVAEAGVVILELVPDVPVPSDPVPGPGRTRTRVGTGRDALLDGQCPGPDHDPSDPLVGGRRTPDQRGTPGGPGRTGAGTTPEASRRTRWIPSDAESTVSSTGWASVAA